MNRVVDYKVPLVFLTEPLSADGIKLIVARLGPPDGAKLISQRVTTEGVLIRATHKSFVRVRRNQEVPVVEVTKWDVVEVG